MGKNLIILVGFCGKDPEVVKTDNSKVARFGFATSKTYKDKSGEKQTKTTWHNIVVWGKLADVVENYVKKGSQLYLEGEQDNRSYEKDGQTKYISEVNCRSIELLGSKPESNQSNQVEEPDNDNPPF